jgi:hypothetical protein
MSKFVVSRSEILILRRFVQRSTIAIDNNKSNSTMADPTGEPSGDKTNVDAAVAVEPLKLIWDDEMVEQFNTEDGKLRWRCLYCKGEFVWNHTKAAAHVSKAKGEGIRPCHKNIPKEKLALYKAVFQRTVDDRNKKNGYKSSIQASIQQAHSDGAAALAQLRKGRNQGTVNKGRSVFQSPSPLSSVSISAAAASASAPAPAPARVVAFNKSSSSKSSSTSIEKFVTVKGEPVQTTVTNERSNPENARLLTCAIADLIQSCGLPFRLADEPKFRTVITLARAVGSTYRFPGRNEVAGDLLALNYKRLQDQQMAELIKQATTFGLVLYADGATVRRMPLINILAIVESI